MTMTSRKHLLSALALSLACVTAPVMAHHSYSMFDMSKTVVLDAQVTRFKWQNPHAFIEVDAMVNGTKERWSIEMTSPNNLIQSGWKRTSLKPGDKVKLYVHPLRSGARGGAYSGVRFADGSTLGEVD